MHSTTAAATLPKPNYNGTSHKDPPSRLSPPPLAPLQFLQSQRRGSITDPSLHAAPSMKPPPNYHSQEFNSKHLPFPRPTSPYVFGDATAHLADNSPRIQNLLRSPSPNRPIARPSSEANSFSQTKGSFKPGEISPRSQSNPNQLGQDRPVPRELLPFDYNMRRHSIAATQDFHPTIGTKRKMSTDRVAISTVSEETESQLVGPGVPSLMEVDPDIPAPKRRGSAVDTQKIAQLSLNDRRNSVDARVTLGQWPGWSQTRRGSTPNLLPSSPPIQVGFTPSTPGSSAGGPGISQSRLPPGIATFSWPPNDSNASDQPTTASSESNIAPTTSQRVSDRILPLDAAPPSNLISNRRMSVPDILSSAPSKGLRSQSRPPSQTTLNGDSNAQVQDGRLDELDEYFEGHSATGPSKDKHNTPYSRSPELRVSHKLAERKRRKEMKDLFDELRDQLPADRGMKASKWEILSKAIDFVAQLKQSHQDMAREMDLMRQELDAVRQGVPFQPNNPPPTQSSVAFMQPPMSLVGSYSGTMASNGSQAPPPLSRSGSSENTATSPSPIGGSNSPI